MFRLVVLPCFDLRMYVGLTVSEKQPVNEAIVGKLLHFRLLKQFSVFLRKSVNVIT